MFLMNLDFNDLLNMLDGEDFEERPVSIEEFVQSEDYLNLPTLSENQYKLIKASSQIYKKTTLVALYGELEAEKRFAETMNEVIFQLGKGSGKGYTSSIACAYIVYLLMCLKDPAKYYGKPPGDHIAILNIAINAAQAQNVFFKYFKQRITSSPWFAGKYTEKAGEFQFDKNVFVYSGHSEREAWEGYNVIFVILDEISGFALDSTSGNEQAKTASAVYKMYKQSVTSRFPEFGKVVLLSFPRFKNDFIQQRYADVIAEKETITRTYRFKVNPDLPENTEGNEFDIEWEEDHIISYRIPKVFALKRPTWEINPLIKLDDLMAAFYDDPIDSLSRFACMPPDAIDAFFKDRAKIESAFSSQSSLKEDNSFRPDFIPNPEKRYYVHVDLARVHDHAAVALAHVEKWEQRNIGGNLTEPAPVVIVDQVRYWTPSKTKNVDFTEIREYILSLKRRGFNIRLVTFDRWESADTMQYLNDRGLRAERLSVAKKHYEDFAMVIAEQRVVGPKIELLIEELLQLRIMNNDKVDHPRKGSKDLSDAVCGAIFNAIAHTPRNLDETIEVKTLESVHREVRQNKLDKYEQMKADGVIRAPKRQMPQELEDFLARISTI
ncbi:terminase [Streptomyces phage Annadreamy]|uniref:Terminase n=1 Tax=Streptomyces phage Annadreamy TaxID=2250335 RepID=A0A345GTD3_9CAUD|nr:terminase [Streptomyces phage Annadreamy]AXG66205.1 terminase [Streptomyces phage Annadreamy]